MRMDVGIFSQIPPELFYHILKFLPSEGFVSCSLVCGFLNFVAADESLWCRLYCMLWGQLPPKMLRECAWKKLYMQCDEDNMAEFVWDYPSEFKEYYIQMQVAMRKQAPHHSIIIDKTLADQISMWKSSRGLTDTLVLNHVCSGETCTYYQIEDVFVCEKTGNAHVCDDTCEEVMMDPANELLVCTISGCYFDRFSVQLKWNLMLNMSKVVLQIRQSTIEKITRGSLRIRSLRIRIKLCRENIMIVTQEKMY